MEAFKASNTPPPKSKKDSGKSLSRSFEGISSPPRSQSPLQTKSSGSAPTTTTPSPTIQPTTTPSAPKSPSKSQSQSTSSTNNAPTTTSNPYLNIKTMKPLKTNVNNSTFFNSHKHSNPPTSKSTTTTTTQPAPNTAKLSINTTPLPITPNPTPLTPSTNSITNSTTPTPTAPITPTVPITQTNTPTTNTQTTTPNTPITPLPNTTNPITTLNSNITTTPATTNTNDTNNSKLSVNTTPQLPFVPFKSHKKDLSPPPLTAAAAVAAASKTGLHYPSPTWNPINKDTTYHQNNNGSSKNIFNHNINNNIFNNSNHINLSNNNINNNNNNPNNNLNNNNNNNNLNNNPNNFNKNEKDTTATIINVDKDKSNQIDKYKDWRHNKLFNQIQAYKQTNPTTPLQAYLLPWSEPPLPYPHPRFSIKLHQEILDFVSDVGERTYPHVQNCHQVINLIKTVVKRLWPNAELDIFGSFMTGLWLPSSDIDIVVNYGMNMNIKPKNALFLLEVLEKQLRTDLNHCILTMLCIPSAKIPVIKLVTKENIAVDISFRESPTSPHTGIAARDLVADNVREVVGLYPLAIVLKWFLRERGLNNTYSGGLSSYCLVLMLISFLKNNEHCPKKITSPSQTNIKEDLNNNNNNNNISTTTKIATGVPTLKAKPCTCENADQISGLNIGCALMRFLEYYGVNFNYQMTGISIEENRYTFPLERDENNNMMNGGTSTTTINNNNNNNNNNHPQLFENPFNYGLFVSDPFVAGKNVASGAFNFGRVKAAFQYAFATLSNTSMNELSFEKETILSKILMPSNKQH
eukprot:gene4550-5668_t